MHTKFFGTTLVLALVLLLSGCASPGVVSPASAPSVPQTLPESSASTPSLAQSDTPSPKETPPKAPISTPIPPSPNLQSSLTSNNTMPLLNQYDSAVLRTSLGDITIKFYAEASPNTVENFLKLAHGKFYDGTRFHRVIKGFMIQGGDPNSKDTDWSNDGVGGPGYAFADEFNKHALVKGSLAMANAGPNTNGSQFFIVTAPATPWLDGHHTNFGEVTSGMDIVEAIESAKVNGNDHPLEDVTVKSIDLIKKK
jgi:peptidyl-prolyl cis-trans isomerase B (cyclophilin B)